MFFYLLPFLLSPTSAFVLGGKGFSFYTEPSLRVELTPRQEIRASEFSLGSGSSDIQQIRDLESVQGNKTLLFIGERDDPDYETTAPPSTKWQGMTGSQWDDWSQDVVVKAWNLAMELAKAAVSSLEALQPGSIEYQNFQHQTVVVNGVCEAMKTDQTRKTTQYLLCYRHFIAANNLAYGQLFAADPENIGLIQSRFQRVLDQTGNLTANGKGNPGANSYIRDKNFVYLTRGPTISDPSGENLCAGETQAVTVVADGTKEFASSNSVPKNAYIIHFCPPFFNLPRMEDTLEKLQKNPSQKTSLCNLNALDSTARTMLHEITHLPWVLNTNYNNRPQDVYGFYSATSRGALIDNPNQGPITKKFSSQNADSYAWMAVYNFFNSLNSCQGVKYTGPKAASASCNTDVWPSGLNSQGKSTPKLIDWQWKGYTKAT